MEIFLYGNFLGTQHQATDKVYSLVYIFSWPKRNGHFLKTKSLQIGSVILLEINTEHQKCLQIGFEIFLEINIWHFENTKSLQIGFSWFFSFLGTQHQATDKVYSLVYNFLGQNEMGTF